MALVDRGGAWVTVPLRFLVAIGEHHVPRLLVITTGMVGTLCGLFFLLMPDGGTGYAAWSFLLHSAPPNTWAALFLIVGGGLTSAGIIQHTKAGWLCFVEALIFFWLSLASIDSIDNWGTKIICFVSITFGWLCLIGMLASMAADQKRTVA
jgi:hypothetical protein